MRKDRESAVTKGSRLEESMRSNHLVLRYCNELAAIQWPEIPQKFSSGRENSHSYYYHVKVLCLAMALVEDISECPSLRKISRQEH